jgi:hypothetical protein
MAIVVHRDRTRFVGPLVVGICDPKAGSRADHGLGRLNCCPATTNLVDVTRPGRPQGWLAIRTKGGHISFVAETAEEFGILEKIREAASMYPCNPACTGTSTPINQQRYPCNILM